MRENNFLGKLFGNDKKEENAQASDGLDYDLKREGLKADDQG